MVLFVIIGFIGSLYFYSQFLYHIFYFLPKTLYYVARGVMKPIAIVICFVNPVIWFFILFVVGFFFPSALDFLADNPGIGTGSNIALVMFVGHSLFTKKGRSEVKEEYWESIGSKYSKSEFSEDW